MSYHPHIVIDSGAFSAWNSGVHIDLDDWIRFCKKLLKRKPDAEVINLDVIPKDGNDTGKESYENWVRMRDAGVDAIPVYHATSSPRWLEAYLEAGVEHIALGAVAKTKRRQRTLTFDRIWENYLIDSDRMPIKKVHAMGVTSWALLKKYPWHSVDSTSWIKQAAYGRIYTYPPHQRLSKHRPDRHPGMLSVSPNSNKKKVAGCHIDNLTPGNRKRILDHIEELGFPMGVSKDGEIVERGLTNCYRMRCHFNALIFSIFASDLRWPRPLKTTNQASLFQSAPEGNGKGPYSRDHQGELPTRMYFSGAMEVEDLMAVRPDEFEHCGVMLSYFGYLTADLYRRRLRAMIRGGPYPCSTRREVTKK